MELQVKYEGVFFVYRIQPANQAEKDRFFEAHHQDEEFQDLDGDWYWFSDDELPDGEPVDGVKMEVFTPGPEGDTIEWQEVGMTYFSEGVQRNLHHKYTFIPPGGAAEKNVTRTGYNNQFIVLSESYWM